MDVCELTLPDRDIARSLGLKDSNAVEVGGLVIVKGGMSCSETSHSKHRTVAGILYTREEPLTIGDREYPRIDTAVTGTRSEAMNTTNTAWPESITQYKRGSQAVHTLTHTLACPP